MLEVVRSRGTCPRARHGAIVVKDNRILATGYNGSPPRLPHCEDVECLIVDGHCKRTIHAEANAYLQAANVGVSLEGATLYVTGQPCIDCMKDTLSVGITYMVIADIEEFDNVTAAEQEFMYDMSLEVGVKYVSRDEHGTVCPCGENSSCECG